MSWLHAVAALSVLLPSIYAAPAQNKRHGIGDCLFDNAKAEIHTIDIEMRGWESNPVSLDVKFFGSGQFGRGYEVLAPSELHGGRTIVNGREGEGFLPDITKIPPEGIKSCETLRKIYDLIFREQMRYLETYGWLHEDSNFANFHFGDGLTRVEIFDWGVSRNADPPEANEDMYTRLMKVYGGLSMLPTHDTTFNQGICESKKRKKYSLTFFSPFE